MADLDWFRPSHGVIALCPVLIYYAMKIELPLTNCGLLLLYYGELPHRYGIFPILLQLTKIRTQSRL
jgi:hypothetical protein